jgi:hypothetical protein
MPDIRNSPLVQLVTVLAVIGALAAAVATQLPEIRRYLNVRSMD